MEIILLTHERELTKDTNTGRLVRQCLGGRARFIVWQRKNPDPNLIERLKDKKMALLYLDEVNEEGKKLDIETIAHFEGYIIIDATWQQARKMYNHSEYLKKMPKVSISSEERSVFKRRRNQVRGGLCTAECVVELLVLNSELNLANNLLSEFEKFNEATSCIKTKQE